MDSHTEPPEPTLRVQLNPDRVFLTTEPGQCRMISTTSPEVHVNQARATETTLGRIKHSSPHQLTRPRPSAPRKVLGRIMVREGGRRDPDAWQSHMGPLPPFQPRENTATSGGGSAVADMGEIGRGPFNKQGPGARSISSPPRAAGFCAVLSNQIKGRDKKHRGN